MFDATFWVAVSFVIFFVGLIYLKVPQNVNSLLTKMIVDIKKEIDEISAADPIGEVPDMGADDELELCQARRRRYFKDMRLQSWLYALLRGAKWSSGRPLE